MDKFLTSYEYPESGKLMILTERMDVNGGSERVWCVEAKINIKSVKHL